MGKMPELVELQRKYADQGFEVVGINFDDDEAVANKAIDDTGQAWAQVHARTAAKGKSDYWSDVSGIEGLPRVMILDRKGILRTDAAPHDLEKMILALLEKGGEKKE